MEFAIFYLCYAGAAWLCLAMDRHHQEVFGAKPSRVRKLALRLLGTALLAGAFVAAGAARGWRVGAVEWVGALGLSGIVLILQHGLRPRWTLPAGALSILLAAVLIVAS